MQDVNDSECLTWMVYEHKHEIIGLSLEVSNVCKHDNHEHL